MSRSIPYMSSCSTLFPIVITDIAIVHLLSCPDLSPSRHRYYVRTSTVSFHVGWSAALRHLIFILLLILILILILIATSVALLINLLISNPMTSLNLIRKTVGQNELRHTSVRRRRGGTRRRRRRRGRG